MERKMAFWSKTPKEQKSKKTTNRWQNNDHSDNSPGQHIEINIETIIYHSHYTVENKRWVRCGKKGGFLVQNNKKGAKKQENKQLVAKVWLQQQLITSTN